MILELVGGDNLATNVERLAPRGRIVVIGTGAGAGRVDFGLLMRKRGRIHGSTLRARTAEEKALVVGRLARGVVLPLSRRPVAASPGRADVPARAGAGRATSAFGPGGKFGKLVDAPRDPSGHARRAGNRRLRS